MFHHIPLSLQRDSNPQTLIVRKRTLNYLAKFNHLTKYLWIWIPLQSFKLITSVLSKEFLDIQATTECRFTLKYVFEIMRKHSLLVILAIFFSAFSCIHFMSISFWKQRYLSRDHRISCPAHHLEQTDNKSFSGMIGPRHKTKSRVVDYQSSVARRSSRAL